MSIEYNFMVGCRSKKTGKLGILPGTSYETKKDDWYGTDEKTDETVTRLKTIMYRTGSWMPRHFEDEFTPVSADDCDEELQKAFTYKNWNDKEEFSDTLSYMTLDELNALKSDYIKHGYYLVDDVDKYEKYKEDSCVSDLDIFYDAVSPTVYANMCAKQIKRHQEKDAEGYEYTAYGFDDYMPYSWPDYDSQEFLVSQLQTIMNSYKTGIEFIKQFNDLELVLLMEVC